MNGNPVLVLLTFLIPLGAAPIGLLLGKIGRTLRNGFLFLATLASFVLSLWLFFGSRAMGGFAPLSIGGLDMGHLFYGDGFGIFLAVLFSGLGFLVTLYSFSHTGGMKSEDEYFFMLPLMMGALIGVCFSANLILVYIFWELAEIGTWRLIGFYRNEEEVKAANKAFLILFGSASLMLAAFGLIYAQYGTLNLLNLKAMGATLSSPIVLLFLFGILAKSATFPLYSWIQDAYGAAPSGVNAYLSGGVENIGIIVFARLFIGLDALPPGWKIAVGFIAGISALITAAVAYTEKDMKRILAFSTVSQLAYIFMGLAAVTVFGVTGALLYMLAHAVAKAGLFMGVGIVEKRTGERDITRLGGLFREMPVLGGAFFLLALSIVGLPPLLGFFSKAIVVTSSFSYSKPVAVLAIAAALFTFLYMGKLFRSLFLGDTRIAAKGKNGGVELPIVVLLALVSLALGVLATFPLNTIKSFVEVGL
jgi:formate hydrogenlyase subunit 3/multisubunit Na+/H+ antiporter MnhD subunit